ncbi:transcriptional regulator [Streptomyces griseocarneus]|nr:transcriptional regulator [Streptomyces griseocarneus]
MDRKALGRLLRSRRAQINPEDHNLERAPRTPGLTQAQMDVLTHRSLKTYQRLETGQYPNPPEDLLYDVAKILKLTQEQWFVLWRYATETDPPYPLYPTSGMEIPAAWADVVQGMKHMAYVNDASWNVVIYNEAWAELFPSGVIPENTMRWMLLDEDARTRILIGWEEYWAPHVISQFRTALAAAPGDQVLRDIERDALAHPVVGPVYRRAPHEFPRVDGAQRPLHHARLGPGWITMLIAEPLSSPRSRLVVLDHQVDQQSPTSLWAPSLNDSSRLHAA